MKLKLNQIRDPFRQLICEYSLDGCADLNVQLKMIVGELRLADPNGVIKSNSNGWHSPDGFHMQDLPAVKKLNQLFYSSIGNYIQQYDKKFDLTHFNIKLMSWANLNNLGGGNITHLHPNSLISGTYYVKVPAQNVPKIRFYNTSGIQYLKNISDLGRSFAQGAFSFTPKEGDLILFPSNIFHSVDTNQNDEERVSIAFNAYLEKK